MTEIPEILENKLPKHKSKLWIILTLGGVFLCGAFFTLVSYAHSAEDRTLPGLFIGDIAVGNLTHDELKTFLTTRSSKLSTDGIHFDLKLDGQSHEFILVPETVTDADVVQYITVDADKETDRIFSLGKNGNTFTKTISFWSAKLHDQDITLENVFINKQQLAQAIHEHIAPYEAPPQDSRLVFTSFDPLKYTISTSTSGYVFAIAQSIDQIEASWKSLSSPNVVLQSRPTSAIITKDSWTPFFPQVASALSFGPVVLDQVDDKVGLEKEWKIPVSTLASWLTIARGNDGANHLVFDVASSTKYLENKIAPDVLREAKSAKFTVDADGKVKEFQASQMGVALDTTTTLQSLQVALQARINGATSSPVRITLHEVEPNITTGDVNDLGIKEILGFGVSNYSGSPANRIKNIRNAVRKLNGILIQAGEEFSAIKYTQPYTLEGGYFPELVIKGDEIKPEIGGGLCQIGTTLFRMAMNSGMKITERRNHSLAITYYNDPRNGQPGTDATIYEPSPDFRFLNDTSSTILIQTDMNEKTGELKFTLWGTSDGRKGSYTKPLVSKRLPVGPTRFTETTTLAPGQKKCQHAYPGAVASFTYTRVLANGTKEDQVFDSYYRSLPEICLVGVEKVTPAPATCPEGQTCAPVDVPADAAADVPVRTASSTN